MSHPAPSIAPSYSVITGVTAPSYSLITGVTPPTSDPPIDPNLPPEAFHEYTLKGKKRQLVDVEYLANKQPKLGAYWDYGIKVLDRQSKQCYWICNLCKGKKKAENYVISRLTSSEKIYTHLSKCHQIYCRTRDQPACENIRISNFYETMGTAKDTASEAPPAKSTIALTTHQHFLQLLVKLITIQHLPFSLVEAQPFREFAAFLNPSLVTHIPKKGTTAKEAVMKTFLEEKKKIRNLIQKAVSSIHISFDLWTSNNSIALLGMCAHFTDANYNIRTVMIALRHITGSHTGEHIAECVLDIIKDYRFEDNLGYIVLDNAESNDTACTILLQTLDTGLDKVARRLRCMGHIINLAAQSLLLGNVLLPEHQHDHFLKEAMQHEQQNVQHWRKNGPIAKLQRLVKYIRLTPQRRERFQSIKMLDQLNNAAVDKLMVKADNATRWNSLDDAIERSILIKERLDVFCLKEGEAIKDNALSQEDWAELVDFHDILKMFKKETRKLEGRALTGKGGAAHEVLPTIRRLIVHVEQQQKRFIGKALSEFKDPDDHHIYHSLKSCHKKLTHYEELLSRSLVYAAAVVMDPQKKWLWFTQKRPEFKGTAEIFIRQLWDYYKNRHIGRVHGTAPTTLARPSPPPAPSGYDSDDSLIDDEPQHHDDAYSRYINEPRVSGDRGFSPADWWRAQPPGPLKEMAMDLLSIPAMSAECERIFSSASRLITASRSSLLDATIEASECLKNWYTGRFDALEEEEEAIQAEIEAD